MTTGRWERKVEGRKVREAQTSRMAAFYIFMSPSSLFLNNAPTSKSCFTPRLMGPLNMTLVTHSILFKAKMSPFHYSTSLLSKTTHNFPDSGSKDPSV